MKKPQDSQITEIAGIHYLTSELLFAGVEVASPVRDRGVDLIAYFEVGDEADKFSSCPIQMKASMGRRFRLDEKYKKILNLLIVYVWNLDRDSSREIYALTYEEALKIVMQINGTENSTWKNKGYYLSNSPSSKTLSLLERHKMNPTRWRGKILGSVEYDEREKQKQEGWNLYHYGSSISERAGGLMAIIDAHYRRNPDAPNLKTYTSHWLWASMGQQFDPQVIEYLTNQYPLPKQPKIQRGYSDWNSYGNSNYPIDRIR